MNYMLDIGYYDRSTCLGIADCLNVEQSLTTGAKLEIQKEADLMKGQGHLSLKLFDCRLFTGGSTSVVPVTSHSRSVQKLDVWHPSNPRADSCLFTPPV